MDKTQIKNKDYCKDAPREHRFIYLDDMEHGGSSHRHGLACIVRASLTGAFLAAVGSYTALRQCCRVSEPRAGSAHGSTGDNQSEKKTNEPRPVPEPAKPPAGLLQELLPFLLGAVPVLVPLLALGLFADSAVAAAVLWQGGISALFLAMVPLLLPLVAGGTVLVLRHALGGPAWWRIVAFVVTLVLLTVVPLSFALVQAVIVLVAGALGVRRWLPARLRRWLPARLQGGAVICAAVVVVLVCAGVWPGLRTAAIGRVISGIPEEMILYNDSMVSQPARVRVLQAGDQFTTVLDDNPPHVVTIPNSFIYARVACQSPRTTINQRSLIETIHHLMAEGSVSDSSGTMVCGK